MTAPLIPMQTARTAGQRKARAAPSLAGAEVATLADNVEFCLAGARDDRWVLGVLVFWIREDGLQQP